MPLLELPVLVTRHIMQHVYGDADDAHYDLDTWAEAEVAQNRLGWKWAVRFLPTKFSDFLRLAARQGNADIFQAGGLWVYKWKQRRDPVLAITSRTQVELPRFARTPPRTALALQYTAQWDQNFATGEWRSAKTITSPLADRLPQGQRGRMLVTNQPTGFDMPYVADAATADALARLDIAQRDHQKWHVSVSTDWDALIAEKGDTITVDAALLLQSVGSLVGTFVVQGKTYDPASDAIWLDAEQADATVMALAGSLTVRAPADVFTLAGSLAVPPRLFMLGSLSVPLVGIGFTHYYGRRSPLWPDKLWGPLDERGVRPLYGHPLCPDRAWLPRVPNSATGSVAPRNVELIHGAPDVVWGEPRKAGVSRFGPGVEWAASGDGAYGMNLGRETNVVPANGNVTIIVAKTKASGVSTKGNTFGTFDTGPPYTDRCSANVPFQDGVVYFDYGGVTAGASRISVGGLTPGDDIWAFTVGPRGMEIWQNAIRRAANSGTPTRVDGGGNFYLAGGADTSAFTRTPDAVISLFWVYFRQLSESEIANIHSDPYQWLERGR